MKKYVLFEIFSRLLFVPKFRKKMKLIAVVGVLGLVVTLALVGWAGVSIVRYASNHIQSLNVPSLANSLEDQIGTTFSINSISCWNQFRSQLNLETWTTIPIADNIKNLKGACMNTDPPPVSGG